MVKKGPFFQEKWGKSQGSATGRGVLWGFLKEICGNLRNRGGGLGGGGRGADRDFDGFPRGTLGFPRGTLGKWGVG